MFDPHEVEREAGARATPHLCEMKRNCTTRALPLPQAVVFVFTTLVLAIQAAVVVGFRPFSKREVRRRMRWRVIVVVCMCMMKRKKGGGGGASGP
jgi:hypothetical protein